MDTDSNTDRFGIIGRMEILATLQNLLRHHETISVQFNEGREFLLSALLNVRSEGIVFDLGGDEGANLRLAKSAKLTFSANPDGIKVIFSCNEGHHRVSWDGGEAFWAPLPTRIIRLQRREQFRVIAPVAKPILLSTDLPSLGPVRLQVHNLSVGGIGLTLSDVPLKIAIGTKLPLLSLRIPEGELLEFSGAMRHITPLASNDGKSKLRLGIGFDHLSRSTDALLQRLVIHIDQERRKLADGNG